MRLTCLCLALLLGTAASGGRAAERKFDFSITPTNLIPTNCVSLVGGEGKPGDWRVILDEAPVEPAPFSTNTTAMGRKSVVAQLARDTTDEHFPMLVLGNDIYGDFTFTMRFKIVDGREEQMAGFAFRIQDERNYYYVRASALGGTFYFYKVEKGARAKPVGNNLPVQRGVWHELTVQCEGMHINIKLDGKEALPTMTDPTFAAGKIALWTKSDSVSYFADPRITFKPRESFAQQMVNDTMKEYSRLAGLKLYAPTADGKGTHLIASNDGKDIGQAGAESDADTIKRGMNYYLKKREVVVVTMPLRDRNGDPVAAVRVELTPLLGQTEQNALIRALPIVKTMQERLALARSITE